MFYGSKKCIFLDIIKLVLPIILIKPHRSEPLHGAPEARQEDCYTFHEKFFWLFFLPLSTGTLATHSCGKLPSCTRRNHFGTPRQELGSCDMKHSETLGSPPIPNSTDALFAPRPRPLSLPPPQRLPHPPPTADRSRQAPSRTPPGSAYGLIISE